MVESSAIPITCSFGMNDLLQQLLNLSHVHYLTLEIKIAHDILYCDAPRRSCLTKILEMHWS